MELCALHLRELPFRFGLPTETAPAVDVSEEFAQRDFGCWEDQGVKEVEFSDIYFLPIEEEPGQLLKAAQRCTLKNSTKNRVFLPDFSRKNIAR